MGRERGGRASSVWLERTVSYHRNISRKARRLRQEFADLLSGTLQREADVSLKGQIRNAYFASLTLQPMADKLGVPKALREQEAHLVYNVACLQLVVDVLPFYLRIGGRMHMTEGGLDWVPGVQFLEGTLRSQVGRMLRWGEHLAYEGDIDPTQFHTWKSTEFGDRLATFKYTSLWV